MNVEYIESKDNYELAKSKLDQVWPPMVASCPDYWIDISGNAQCVNLKDLGTCNSNPGPDGHSTMDFSGDTFSGENGPCAKFTWANKCGVSWDGITYGYGEQNPCQALVDSKGGHCSSSAGIRS